MAISLNASNLSKFIIIASACRSHLSPAKNIQRTAKAHMMLKQCGRYVQDLELVTGFYREHGASKGAFEQSFSFGVNTPRMLKNTISMFCGEFNQDCILVWNRDTNSVWLYSEDGMTELGQHGMYQMWASVGDAESNDWIEPDAYTIAGNGSIWAVR